MIKTKVYFRIFDTWILLIAIFEYFIRNIGSAPYRGRGSSVKKKAGDDSTNGVAYRIYGCGIFIDDVSDRNTKKFIVPLESVIILPR